MAKYSDILDKPKKSKYSDIIDKKPIKALGGTKEEPFQFPEQVVEADQSNTPLAEIPLTNEQRQIGEKIPIPESLKTSNPATDGFYQAKHLVNVTDATMRGIDDITSGNINIGLNAPLAIGKGIYNAVKDGVVKYEEAVKTASSGELKDLPTAGLQALNAGVTAGFGVLTATNPTLQAYTAGLQIASGIAPKEVQFITTPIASLTEPETALGKAGAETADVALQFLIAGLGEKLAGAVIKRAGGVENVPKPVIEHAKEVAQRKEPIAEVKKAEIKPPEEQLAEARQAEVVKTEPTPALKKIYEAENDLQILENAKSDLQTLVDEDFRGRKIADGKKNPTSDKEFLESFELRATNEEVQGNLGTIRDLNNRIDKAKEKLVNAKKEYDLDPTPQAQEAQIDSKQLFKKVLNEYGQYPLNSPKLGEYANSKLPTTEVMKRLNDLGILEDVKGFNERLNKIPTNDPQLKGQDFELMARIALREADKSIPKPPQIDIVSATPESGETKIRGLAQSTESKAIATGITKSIEGLPEYEVLKNEPQIAVASDLIATDLARAKRIALGQEQSPNTTLPGFVYKGLEDYAVKNNDFALMKELGTSSYLAEQGTTAGQFIQSLRNQDPLSPIKAIKEITEARKGSFTGQREARVGQIYEQKIKTLETKLTQKEEYIKNLEANKIIRKIDFEARKEKRTYTKETLQLERKDLFAQLYKSTASQVSANPFVNPEAIKLLGEITKNYVKEGITDVAQIVDSIHLEIQDKFEGITKRDIRDAISGYGKVTEKTRNELQATISDLKQQMVTVSKIEDIESGKAPIKTKTGISDPSQELQSLREELKTKMKESGITAQESLAKSKERIQNAIKETNNKIVKGDYSKAERPKPIVDEEKIALQKELKDARERLENIRKSTGQGVSEAEVQRIAELSKTTSEAKKIMESSPRRGLGEKATPEELAYGRARIDFAEYIDNLKESANALTFEEFKSNPKGTLLKGLKHIPGITKSAKATLDNSALFNQHIKTLWTHPTIWSKNALNSFKDIANSLGGKNVLKEISADIVSRPNYEAYRKDGLAVHVVEEAFPDSKLLEKIPYFGRVHKAADVAFTGLAYRNRADLYDLYTEIAKKAGNEETTGLGIGRLVNSLTGRGNIGKLEAGGNLINVLLFAPRYVKSHWDVLTAHTFEKEVSPFAKKEAAKNLLKIVGGTAAVMASAKAMGANVELDPRSSDFGSIKVGNTRFHFMGGMNSLVTLASKLLPTLNEGEIGLYSKSTVTGDVNKLNSGKYGAQTAWDALLNFGEGKLAPVASLARNVWKGQAFGGGRLTLGGELSNLIMPLPIANAQELINDPKSANLVMATIADAVGLFTSTYSTDANLKKVNNALLRADEEIFSDEQMNGFYEALDQALQEKSVTQDQYNNYIKQFNELQKGAKPKKED